MPSEIFAHESGNTIRKVIKEGSRELSIQRSASIINDATGVAFMMEKSGDSRISNGFTRDVRTANSIPSSMPEVIPKSTRKRDVKRIT